MSRVIFCSMLLLGFAAAIVTADIPKMPSDTSKVIEVDVLRWFEDGSLGPSIMKMSKSEFQEYVGELGSCTTQEEAVAVLQEYNIVPSDVTADHLGVTTHFKSFDVLPFENKSATKSKMWEICYGLCCRVNGTIYTPFVILFVPGIYYAWENESGGEVIIICLVGGYQSCQCSHYHRGLMIGTANFSPPIHWGPHWFLPRDYSGTAFFYKFSDYPYKANQGFLARHTEAHATQERDFSEANLEETGHRTPVPAVAWERQIDKYGGSDWAFSVQQASDGGYFSVASAYDTLEEKMYAWLIKTDEEGERVWDSTYGGENYDQSFEGWPTNDGGYILTGSRYTDDENGHDIWLLKTNSNGNEDWERRFNYTTNDKATSVMQTDDNGYIITGFVASDSAAPCSSSCLLIKTHADGTMAWDKTFSEGTLFMGKSVRQTSDGGYIILGNTASWPDNDLDIVLLKTDPSGNEVWRNVLGDSGVDFGSSVRQPADGGYVIVGWTESFGNGMSDVWLLRTDSAGDTVWTQTFGGPNHDWGFSLDQTDDNCDGEKDDGYILTGFRIPAGSDNPELWLIKTWSDGHLDWDMTLAAGETSYVGQSVWQTSDGGYVVAGCRGSESGGDDLLLVKLSHQNRTYLVSPDSTDPSADFSTIQAAIDWACPGDTIELADGRFSGHGNRDISFGGKPMVVRSQNGAHACTVDCWGDKIAPKRGFKFVSGEGPESVLEGISITNGNMFQAGNKGGAILCLNSSPTIIDCRISGSYAHDYGGGLYCENSSSSIIGCTISGNRATRGGGIYCATSDLVLQNTILWGNCADDAGDELYLSDAASSCTLTCCDTEPSGIEGDGEDVWVDANIVTDPMFWNPEPCDSAPTAAGVYCVRVYSPCVPDSQPVCGLIGALGIMTGDFNILGGDWIVDVADLVYLINYLYKQGSAPDPLWTADVNCSGVVDNGDVIYLINYLYIGGPAPCCHCPD